ncbi:hypothetical protein L2E82_45096 [Cichorium intybus]|uniref:Uncharacterized protein n=1 Tax=Cichorium intybus TaxID=13427 RepID=A0ACB8ZT05_CICIN|nr:hypothetical protein L2E82_45096 [Cichorium intybus]
MLNSWRSVWKDRKKTPPTGPHGSEFKTSSCHRCQHGAKFYGIPESYIRACVAACPVCSDSNASGGARSKRLIFE